MIKHKKIYHGDDWADQLKGKDLKQALRNLLVFLETTDYAEKRFPTSNNPKITIREEIGEIVALAFFELTQYDPRYGYRAKDLDSAYNTKKIRGLTLDDRGVDLVGSNLNDSLTTFQTKLIGDFNHHYGTGKYSLEERLAVKSYIEESANIFAENNIILKQKTSCHQQVLFMTCKPIPSFTSEYKLRGKIRQLCFGKTDNKKGIININEHTNKNFVKGMKELIIESAMSEKI